MKRINKGPKKKCKYTYESCESTYESCESNCNHVYELFWDKPRADNSCAITWRDKICPPFKTKKLCKRVTKQKKKSLIGLVK